MNLVSKPLLLALMTGGALGLVGCSGSSSDDNTAPLTIGLTDAPIDGAEHVWIQFSGLELKRAGGGPAELYDFDPDACDVYDAALDTCTIDLLALQGTEQRSIFAQDVAVGDYAWVRLLVNAELNIMDSYIELYDETNNLLMCPLWIPSGAETGLKLVSGITVAQNGSRYMVDLDVRKSITQPPGLAGESLSIAEMCVENYVLKPALRIVDETETGDIFGVIDSGLLSPGGVLAAGCRDEAPADGVIDHLSVYVFEDFDELLPAEVDDYDGAGDPVASAIVDYDGMEYSYEVGWLLTGNYRLGLTCTPDVDSPEADDFGCDEASGMCPEPDPALPPFDFLAERSVEVLAGPDNNGDFPAVP